MRKLLAILVCFGLAACGEPGRGTPMDAGDALVLSSIMNRPNPFPQPAPFPAYTQPRPVAVSCTRVGATVMCY